MKREKSPDENIEIRLPKSKLTIREAACPNGCDLMVPDLPIQGHASIGIRFSFDDVEDMIYLDPTYGSFDNICETPIPEGKVVAFHCPHCKVSLEDEEERCLTCSTPMFVLNLPRGGIVEGCLRKGCGFHRLRIVDLDARFARLYGEHLQHLGISL